jgi:hypothetical protein
METRVGQGKEPSLMPHGCGCGKGIFHAVALASSTEDTESTEELLQFRVFRVFRGPKTFGTAHQSR